MMKDPFLPDPITDYYRGKARDKEERRLHFVSHHKPGFNLRYWRRIVRVSGKIDVVAARLNWVPEQTTLTKALLTSRMAARFIDHVIRRLMEAGVTTPATEHQEWEKQFHHFVDKYLRTETIKDRFLIMEQIRRLHQYTTPSRIILAQRTRHWRLIERTLWRIPNPTQALMESVYRWLHSNLRAEVKAYKICFAAGLYADYLERRHGHIWTFAYRDSMLRLFELIRRYPQVLHAIITCE